jgi:SAM-dependent methyltransferase
MELDINRPLASRIYDYLLGGSHNFPADRAVATRLAENFPALPQWMRLNRWFLYHVADELAKAGLKHYVDLATGLPTQGYLHERVGPDTRIIYNDLDPATVIYARQIIGDRPNIRYVQSDLRNVETILEEAEGFFEGERKVGIIMVGVSYFIEQEPLREVLQKLYDWAAPGSLLAISMIQLDVISSTAEKTFETYRNIGQPVYPRTPEQVRYISGPWRPRGGGFRSVEEYAAEDAGVDVHIERTTSFGDEAMVGAILEKPAA